MIGVSSEIGAFIRELRQTRQMSLGGLAERAAIAKSTLSRWEAGACQPRLPELEAALHALGASPEQRVEALTRIQAPRAVSGARREWAATAQPLQDEAGLFPVGGDLLRAMRRRRGLSQEQVASAMQVRPSTVSYWEQTKTAPPPDRWLTLFGLLGALPEERSFLIDGRLFLAPPVPPAPASLDQLERTLQALRDDVYSGESRATDLRFLVLESQLAPLALCSGRAGAPKGSARAARALLARVLAHYAEWLSWENRPREAFQRADRAVEILRENGALRPASLALPLAIHVLAAVTRKKDRPDSAARAVGLLQSWLSLAPDPSWETRIYRELADHAVDAEAVEAALDFSRRAQSAAERTEEPRAIRISQKVRVRVLTRSGRHQEALTLLPAEEDPVPIIGFFEAIERAELLMRLEERNEVQRWATRAEELLTAYGYSHLRPRVDELARRL